MNGKQIVLALAAAMCGAGADWTAIPEGGEPMLPADPIPAMRMSGSASMAKMEIVPVEGMPFEQAVRVNITGSPKQAWDVQIMARTQGDLKQGDVVLMSFFARGSSSANETGEAYGIGYIQKNSGNYDKLLNLPFTAGSEWKQYLIPGTIGMTVPSGQHEITIFLGYFPQSVEVGGLTLFNYRNTRSVAELPRTRIWYKGSEADAAWRRVAADTIEAIRKSDINVTVRDAMGNPVKDAQVRVRQTRHEFGFGSAVAADGLNASGADGDKYRWAVANWFNKVVLENDLKWPGWEGNRNRALNALAWLRDNGVMMTRGHCLVWPSWRYMPADVEKLATNPEALRARVLNHIVDEMTATRGQLVEWDVINEPYTNTDLMKILGDQEMAEWFKKAREIDPWAVLYINDYSILSNGGMDRAHQDAYFTTIRKLIEWGAPLEGIGMQGHFGGQLTPPERVWEILDRFAQLGKHIHITEFDIDIEDEVMQGQYTRDFMTTVFAHPAVTGFMMWGFWEGRHWKPRAAMVRRNWTLKPNGETFLDLVFNQWWTDVTGQTSADGSFRTRGFKGSYEIEVNASGKSVRMPATLAWKPVAINITLP